ALLAICASLTLFILVPACGSDGADLSGSGRGGSGAPSAGLGSGSPDGGEGSPVGGGASVAEAGGDGLGDAGDGAGDSDTPVEGTPEAGGSHGSAESPQAPDGGEGGEAEPSVPVNRTGYVPVVDSPYSTVDWAAWEQCKVGLHVHTKNSDGADTLAEMIEEHYRKGYDILAITDHNFLTSDWIGDPGGLANARFGEILLGTDRGGRGMLQIPLTIEQSVHHHLNTFFTDYVNPNGPSASLEASIQAAADQGGISHINHPGRYTGGEALWEAGEAASNKPENIERYAAIFLENPTCVGMEIINKQDGESYSDRILWDNVLMRTVPEGRYVWGFSNDDAHSASAVGYSYNVMLMPAVGLDGFRAAMEGGSFYAVARVARREQVGRGRMDSFPEPRMTSVIVDGGAGSITIGTEHVESVEWVADGKVIHVGGTIYLYEHMDEISCYVRANLIGTNGVAFTQPFGVSFKEG
ncbi:MAG: hypothetical protein FWE70_08195, partial [Oscillospiraceae bacterium]|nr:hypothetical protein [Oscillospiraceae bacterium]